MATRKSSLLEMVRDAIRVRHYSIRTEHAYIDWIRRYILFHRKRHPAEMGAAEVGEFLTFLAVRRTVAASTQNQALNAFGTMEGGVDVLFAARDSKDVKEYSAQIEERLRGTIKLVEAEVVDVQHTGLGHPVCVDATSLMTARG